MKKPLILLLLSAAAGAWGGAALRSQHGPFRLSQTPGASSVSPEGSGSGMKAGAVNPASEAAKPRSGSRMPAPSLEELRAAPREERLRLLVRWLPGAEAGQMAALAEEWYAKPLGSGDEIWQTFVLRWVELDPGAAMEFSRKRARLMLKEHGDGDVMTPLDYTYKALGRVNPELALSFLPEERSFVLKRIATDFQRTLGVEKMKAWAMALPDRADLAFLRNAENSNAFVDLSDPAKAAAALSPEQRKYQVNSVATAWAEKDPDAALAWVRSLENPSQKSKGLAAIASALAKSDPAKALEIMESMPAGPLRGKVGTDYVGVLAKHDLQGAMDFLNRNLRGTDKLLGIAAIAAAQASTDPAGALRLLRENGVGDLSRTAGFLVSVQSPTRNYSASYGSSGFPWTALKTIAASDPAGALQLLADTGSLDLPPTGQSDWLVDKNDLPRSLFQDWSGKDPASAARWAAGQNSLGGSQRELLQTAAAPWYAKDPAGAQAFAAGLPEGSGKDGMIRSLTEIMAATDPAGALTWTAKNAGPETFSTVFESMARLHPEQTAAQFASLPVGQQSAHMQSLTDSLSQRSPAAALSFYEALLPEQQAAVKLRDTAMAYARQDPQAASEWITTLPATPAKDTAISGLVDYLINQSADPDPEAAAHWAAASLDEAGRGRRLERVSEAWFKLNPAGAAAAIEAADLSPDVKQTLLRHASAKSKK